MFKFLVYLLISTGVSASIGKSLNNNKIILKKNNIKLHPNNISSLFFTRYRGLLDQESISKLPNYTKRSEVIKNLGTADAEINIGKYILMLYNYRQQTLDRITKVMRAERVCKIHVWLEKDKVIKTKVYKWDTHNRKKSVNS